MFFEVMKQYIPGAIILISRSDLGVVVSKEEFDADRAGKGLSAIPGSENTIYCRRSSGYDYISVQMPPYNPQKLTLEEAVRMLDGRKAEAERTKRFLKKAVGRE